LAPLIGTDLAGLGRESMQETAPLATSPPVEIPDVSVTDTWQALASQPGAVLIDVRTKAEWSYVGLPEVSSLGKQTVLVEWQTFPDGTPNKGFVAELAGKLSALGTGRDAELYFICRSGARSRSAATAMQAAGYARCFNVADGFEGPLDAARHRGTRSGWKAAGLPWIQG
jgi:rhodanese-related sulfurtransferase